MATKSSRMYIRDAISKVLAQATDPMTSVQVSQHPDIAALGADADTTSRVLWQMLTSKKQEHPTARIPYHGKGAPRWEYYDPNRLNPLLVSMTDKVEPEVNTVNPPEFEFNPVDFAHSGLFTARADPVDVSLTTDVKPSGGVEYKESDHSKPYPEREPESIRIEVQGVVITINYRKE